jgi:ferritin-like metal-binding protein YciE
VSALESLTDLLIEGLQQAYTAEQQSLEVLPKLSDTAFAKELKEAFSRHAEQSRCQLKRLKEVLKKRHWEPAGELSDGMKAIMVKAEIIMSDGSQTDPAALDASLIAVAQRARRHEIAVYGTLCTYARILGATEAAKLLQITLSEEIETDQELNDLANTKATRK